MKRFRKIIHFAAAVGLMFFMLAAGSVRVRADGGVAKIVETNAEYATLADAFSAATDGQTIQMLADINDLPSGVDVDKTVTLDLCGKTISTSRVKGSNYTGDYLLAVKRGGHLTIIDSDPAGTGAIQTETIMCGIKMTVKGEAATGTAEASTLASLTVESGTIKGMNYGISGNGTRHGTEITINGGNIVGYTPNDSAGIFQPQDGTLTITGGRITGATGVEIRSGTFNFSGGSIVGNGNPYNVKSNRSGLTTNGAGIAIAQHTTKMPIHVNLTGGHASGIHAISVANPEGEQNTLPPDVTVSVSPSFANSAVTQLPEEYVWLKQEDGSYAPHKHTYVGPKWRWLRIDGVWSVTSSYVCSGEGSCGDTMVLTAAVTEGAGTSPKTYTATDSRGKIDTFTANSYNVTRNGQTQSIEWGMIADFLTDAQSAWTLTWGTRSMVVNRSKKFAFAVTENMGITAATTSGDPNQKIDTTLTSKEAGKAVYNAKWSLPEGSKVISVIIYRGTTPAETLEVADSVLIEKGTKYDTGLKVANGDFTLNLDGLTAGTRQHVLIKIVYNYSNSRKELTDYKSEVVAS